MLSPTASIEFREAPESPRKFRVQLAVALEVYLHTLAVLTSRFIVPVEAAATIFHRSADDLNIASEINPPVTVGVLIVGDVKVFPVRVCVPFRVTSPTAPHFKPSGWVESASKA
jgi:hypothetical protein